MRIRNIVLLPLKIPTVLTLGFAALLVCAAFGQGEFRTRFSPPFAMGAIAGMPYSAESVSEDTQTLADGTNISRPQLSTKMFRDSAGRTRSERSSMNGYPTQRADDPVIVEIYDPVAGYRYILDPVNKVAHRSALPPLPQRRSIVGSPGSGTAAATRPAAPKTADTRPRIETTTESLGTQTIEGLTCEGKLMKTTYPVGTSGNDRPLTRTDETWTSTELKILVLMKWKDLLRGARTMQLKNVSRVEPEFSLFQPPSDFKIVDETGSFEVSFTLP